MKRPRELVQIGCYLRQDQAEERGLVILALQRPYWILEDEGLYCLYVDGADAADATAELEKYETEREAKIEKDRQKWITEQTPARAGLRSLYGFAWFMLLFFALQAIQGNSWINLGQADSRGILQGELWRPLTALTLHADLAHLLANIATGLVFAWALLPLLGTGLTWSGFLLSGFLGNLFNAWFYQDGHRSIGASTAVFGALGVLAAYQAIHSVVQHRRPGWREIFLPLGAGFALLAFLGMGGGEEKAHNNRVDILAHGFGMLAGLALGALAAWFRLPERTTPALQKALTFAAVLLPVIAWAWALLYL